MRTKLLVAAVAAVGILFCVRGTGQAQEKEKAAAKKIVIRAGRLIDGKSETALTNALILIEGERIVSMSAGGTAPAGVEVIDLFEGRDKAAGLCRHAYAPAAERGYYFAEDYDVQLLKQSIPYRAILSARNARIALEHGFTAMRDLETEGAMYADVDIKNAITNGEVPGPRMQVATRAMTPTGMYPLLGYSWSAAGAEGVQYVEYGWKARRKAVREQVMYGADWIKYYSDRRYRFEADGVLHSMVNFTDEEAKAIVDEAHRLGKSGVAHRLAWTDCRGVAGGCGMTIEHGDGLTDALMDEEIVSEGRSTGCRQLRWARTLRRGAAGIGQRWWTWKKPRFRRR